MLARLKAYHTSTVFNRLQTIMDAASLLASSWTYQSNSIYMSALGTTPPPTNGIAWKCFLPCVKRNICAADTALWNLAIITNRALTWYPPPHCFKINDDARLAPSTSTSTRLRRCCVCFAESGQEPKPCLGQTTFAPRVATRMEGPYTFSEHVTALPDVAAH